MRGMSDTAHSVSCVKYNVCRVRYDMAQVSQGKTAELGDLYKFNRSAAPFRIIFSRAYVFTVCSPLLALVRCNLPRSRSVRIQHLS